MGKREEILFVTHSFDYNAQYCIRTLPRVGKFGEIHPPRTERFPRGGDFAPLGSREISRSKEDVIPNASRLEAVNSHSLSISREVLIFENVCMVPICIIAGTLSM